MKPRCAFCSPVGGGEECRHRVGTRKTSRAVTLGAVRRLSSPPPSPRRTVSDITRREVWTRTNLHFSLMPLNCSSTQKVRNLTGGSRKIYVALLWGRIRLMWQFNPLRNRSARSQNIKHSKFPPVVAVLTLRAEITDTSSWFAWKKGLGGRHWSVYTFSSDVNHFLGIIQRVVFEKLKGNTEPFRFFNVQ